jgi:hypothetical protein
MRSKRLSILVTCLLITIVLVFIFLHADDRHESVAAEPPSAPIVAVIAARVGTIPVGALGNRQARRKICRRQRKEPK